MRVEHIGQTLITVNGEFTAKHVCAESHPHQHTWEVHATFRVPARTDARLYRASLDKLLAHWDGTLLPAEAEWSEDIAYRVGRLVNCVRVVVSRPDERIATEWAE